MNFLKASHLKSILIIALLAVMSSCNYTQSFPAKLNAQGATIIDKIKNDNHFEEIQIQEKKSSGSGGNLTTLTVKLYNGKNLPADTVEVKKLGREIAGEIKPVLTDAGEINSYIVLFCTRVIDGNTTNTNYNGYEYSSKEL
ncbi:MAG TPA: hypothetical protein VK668_07960 [Mucilaginibacter sp.]|nr:hypothetical protein [Mucilaginibacter sp.]